MKILNIIAVAALAVCTSCGGADVAQLPPVPQNTSNLRIVSLHDRLLLNTGYIGEDGGASEVPILKVSGSRVAVSSPEIFRPSQLVVVRNRNGTSSTTTVAGNGPQMLELSGSRSLFKEAVAITSFYANSIHPNIQGYRAIADFAVAQLGAVNLNSGVHVLFGDSWFSQEGIEGRLAELLPNAAIINRGIAGNRAEHLLERFDTDLAPLQPDYVWIMVGTNNYTRRHSSEFFASQLKELIRRIHALGSVAIVFEPSVGPPFLVGYEDYELTNLSHEYAERVRALEKEL